MPKIKLGHDVNRLGLPFLVSLGMHGLAFVGLISLVNRAPKLVVHYPQEITLATVGFRLGRNSEEKVRENIGKKKGTKISKVKTVDPQTSVSAVKKVTPIQGSSLYLGYLKELINLNLPPPYPYEARMKGQEGKVTVRVQFNTEGQIDFVKLEQTSGHGVLDEAAIKAIQQWMFPQQPWLRAAHLLIPVRFELVENK